MQVTSFKRKKTIETHTKQTLIIQSQDVCHKHWKANEYNKPNTLPTPQVFANQWLWWGRVPPTKQPIVENLKIPENKIQVYSQIDMKVSMLYYIIEFYIVFKHWDTMWLSYKV